MHTIILPIQLTKALPAERTSAFRTPHCDMAGQNGCLEATVYLPGVEARGVELLIAKQEVVVTARKLHPVRTNWIALSLENCTRDYRLRIKTQRRLSAAHVNAEFDDGVLRIRIARRPAEEGSQACAA
ncbi:MAG TPA: Hsp20/alpha crystallin family protein [Opitutaceae bacterium]|nr:Hsp20/alpha crystallin family protein [Opitutaceae bacterium]